jgi:hypothetical protein
MLSTVENRLILHLGVGENSSSIQTALVKDKKSLESQSISYPNLTGAGFGWQGERGLTAGNGSLKWGKFDWVSNEPIAKFNQILDLVMERKLFLNSNTIVVSSSELSMLFGQKQFWEILYRFQETETARVTCVIYSRDPISHFVESYASVVFNGDFKLQLSDFYSYWITEKSQYSRSVFHNTLLASELAADKGIELGVIPSKSTASDEVFHFLSEVCGVELDSPREFGGERCTFDGVDLEFIRGANSVNSPLGKLMAWEKLDSKFSVRPNKSENYIPVKIPERIIDLLKDDVDFFNRIYGENFRYKVEESSPAGAYEIGTYSQQEIDVLRFAFNAGRNMGRSLMSGYISWSLQQKS